MVGCVAIIEGKNFADILFCLCDRGDDPELLNPRRSCIICSERKGQITIKPLKKISQVSYTALYVLFRVKGVTDFQFTCSSRHKLHEAHGTFFRNSPFIPI